MLKYISTEIYNSTDGAIDGKPSKNAKDVSVIVNVLHYIIMVPLAIYFSYNWFFITFYRDEENKGLNIDFGKFGLHFI